MACKKCKKGFLTYQTTQEEDGYKDGDYKIREYFDRHYTFCSNVMCDWKNIKLQLIKRTKFNLKTKKFE